MQLCRSVQLSSYSADRCRPCWRRCWAAWCTWSAARTGCRADCRWCPADSSAPRPSPRRTGGSSRTRWRCAAAPCPCPGSSSPGSCRRRRSTPRSSQSLGRRWPADCSAAVSGWGREGWWWKGTDCAGWSAPW